MLRSLIVTLFVSAVGNLSAQSLEDFLKIAMENNPGILAKELEYKAAIQKLPQAKALPDPEVNLSFFISPMMLPMGNQIGSISAMQMFPFPGTLEAMKKEASSMADVKHQAIAVTRNELAFKVKTAWYPLLELDEQIRIRQENLRILETGKALATAKFQQGKAPMTDALRADIMIDELNTKIALLEQKRKPLEAAFNWIIGRDGNTPVDIAGNLPEIVPGVVLRWDSLITNNPALAVYDKQIQATEAELAVAKTMKKPMFGVGLQYMPLTIRKDHDVHIPPNTGMDMFMPMITTTIPIWRKKYNAAEEEKRLMQLMYSDMKKDMQNELFAMFEMTWYELGKAEEMIALLNLQMEKTEQIIELLIAAYSNSGQDFEEILRLQQQLFRYQMEKISIKKEYQLTLVMLDYLQGKN